MAIKKSTNYNIEEVFNDLGYNFSDFVKYIEHTNSTVDYSEVTTLKQSTVKQVINKFITNINKDILLEIKSTNTVKYYISFLLRFSDFIDNKYKDLLFIDLNEIIFHEFIENTNEINRSKLSHGSINTYTSILRRVCTFSYENDYTNKNISYKFKKIDYSTLPKYFSEKQIKEIISETNKKNNSILWKTIFITLLGTGLRIHELTNLEIRDFNIENNLITTIGKGNKERKVPIYPGVKKAVLDYLKQTNVNDIRYASGYLFSRQHDNERKTPVSIRSIQYNFQKISEKISLDSRFTIHSFRHTFAVNCLKSNMQLSYLSQILGHKKPSTTAIYTRLLPKDLQQVIEDKYPIPLEKLMKQLLS